MFCKCGTFIIFPENMKLQLKCRRCEEIIDYKQNFLIEECVYIKQNENPVKKEVKRKMCGTIKENCPKCNYEELSYSTVQLRSADEGQTVFYQCTKCEHKFTVNS